MAKRKKYPKLPNGYGSIRYLGKGRRNPYAVHPPVKEFDLEGRAIQQKALCYVPTWEAGFMVLTAYRAGTYTPGMEKVIAKPEAAAGADPTIQRILADYNLTKSADSKIEQKKTFGQVYEDFYKWKYEGKGQSLSAASRNSTKAAFKNCSSLHDRAFADLRYPDLQKVVDDCPLKHSSKELIVSLYRQMYQYAEVMEMIDRDYSKNVTVNIPDDDEHGEPFTDADLRTLWAHKDDQVVEFMLIMIYSGYRISAYSGMTVNIKERYFQGGVKTAAGKDRIVPIHSAIMPLVRRRMASDGVLFKESANPYRKKMRAKLSELGIQDHTPHDCRHTFSALCEKYGVNENDRKRMMGHSFGGDLTNGTYGHRTVEDLRAEIEKIKICD